MILIKNSFFRFCINIAKTKSIRSKHYHRNRSQLIQNKNHKKSNRKFLIKIKMKTKAKILNQEMMH